MSQKIKKSNKSKNFRIQMAIDDGGVTSHGIRKYKIKDIFRDKTTNVPRTIAGGEDLDNRAHIKDSIANIGYIERSNPPVVYLDENGNPCLFDGFHSTDAAEAVKGEDYEMNCEVIEFHSELEKNILQQSLNIDLPRKEPTKHEMGLNLQDLCEQGLIDKNNDADIDAAIKKLCPERGDTFKRGLRNMVKRATGVPVKFMSWDATESQKMLAKNGIGTGGNWNDQKQGYESVLKNATAWREMGKAASRFRNGDVNKGNPTHRPTYMTIGLGGEPAGGNFKKGRHGVIDEAQEVFDNYMYYFNWCFEQGKEPNISDLARFSYVLPQDMSCEHDKAPIPIDDHTNQILEQPPAREEA